MQLISLKAHYDGTSIQLDEPFELPRDAQLLVTILAPSENDASLRGWPEIASNGLAAAYGSDEPEYSESDLQR